MQKGKWWVFVQNFEGNCIFLFFFIPFFLKIILKYFPVLSCLAWLLVVTVLLCSLFVSFVKDLGRDIYDLYAEYAEEEEEDQFPVSPSRLLLSPNKQFILNINVGGTVTLLDFYHNILTHS